MSAISGNELRHAGVRCCAVWSVAFILVRGHNRGFVHIFVGKVVVQWGYETAQNKGVFEFIWEYNAGAVLKLSGVGAVFGQDSL